MHPFSFHVKKATHGFLQTTALVFVAVGTWATFQYHANIGLPHLFSLHSWIGLITVGLLTLQWLGGLFAFVFEAPSIGFRTAIIPYHKMAGALLFIMGGLSSVLGLMNYQSFYHVKVLNSYYSPPSILMNFIAISIILSVAMVLYSVFMGRVDTEEEYEPAQSSPLIRGERVYREPDVREPISLPLTRGVVCALSYSSSPPTLLTKTENKTITTVRTIDIPIKFMRIEGAPK
jgi:uncharacterized membrane protein YidH (DUF202 family)